MESVGVLGEGLAAGRMKRWEGWMVVWLLVEQNPEGGSLAGRWVPHLLVYR